MHIYDWLKEILDKVVLAYPLKTRAIAEARIKIATILAGAQTTGKDSMVECLIYASMTDF